MSNAILNFVLLLILFLFSKIVTSFIHLLTPEPVGRQAMETHLICYLVCKTEHFLIKYFKANPKSFYLFIKIVTFGLIHHIYILYKQNVFYFFYFQWRKMKYWPKTFWLVTPVNKALMQIRSEWTRENMEKDFRQKVKKCESVFEREKKMGKMILHETLITRV